MSYFVGVTGASGVVIGFRVAQELSRAREVYLCVSSNALSIARLEGFSLPEGERIVLVDEEDFFSPVASGSFRLSGTVIAPCSMGTLGRIASGVSSNLIERAADIALKERWPLVLVPRETPLNGVHLENMLRLWRAGAHIVPPVLTFYHNPRSVDDMVNFIVGRVLDILGVEHNLYKRWGCET